MQIVPVLLRSICNGMTGLKTTIMKTLFLSLIAFAGFTIQARAQADIRLYPSRVFFYQQEGRIQQKTIHLVNKSTKKVVCRAELFDWKRDSTGNKVYYPAGTLPASGAGVLSVQHNTIVLQPGEDREITVSLDMKNASEFKNSMLFFTQIDTDSLKKGLKILIQLGVHLYSLPEKYVERQVKIDRATWQDTEDKLGVNLRLSNVTGAIIDTEIKAELVAKDGEQLGESGKIPVSSMPGDSFRIHIPFNKTNPIQNGSKIIVYIDNGFEYPLQVVEIPFKS